MEKSRLISANRLMAALPWLVLFAALLAIFFQSVHNVNFLEANLDEGKYVIKSFWYATGRVQPYSSADATDYMPFAFLLPGAWQTVFGSGLLSVRILSTLLMTLSLLPLFLVCGKASGTGSRYVWGGSVGIALFACTPMSFKYFNAISSFGSIATLSLAALITITSERLSPYVKAVMLGALYFLLYFHRVNMIAAVALLVVFSLLFQQSVRQLLTSAAVFVALAAALFAMYPAKLVYFATQNLPVVSALLTKAGLLSDPYALVSAWTAPSGGFTWAWDQDHIDQALRGLTDRFFLPYVALIILNILNVVYRVVKRDWRALSGFCSAYFLIMAAIHFMGSVSFCAGCLQAYTNYFVGFGVAGGAAILIDLFVWSHARGRRAMACYLLTLLVMTGIVWRPLVDSYEESMSPPGNRYIPRVTHFSQWTKKYIPSDARVLLLVDSQISVQAVAFGDRMPIIPTINRGWSYRRLKKETPPEIKGELLRQLSEVSLWTDDTMERWLTAEATHVLWEPRAGINPLWVALVREKFVKVRSYKVPKGHAFILLKRRPQPPASLPVTP